MLSRIKEIVLNRNTRGGVSLVLKVHVANTEDGCYDIIAGGESLESWENKHAATVVVVSVCRRASCCGGSHTVTYS